MFSAGTLCDKLFPHVLRPDVAVERRRRPRLSPDLRRLASLAGNFLLQAQDGEALDFAFSELIESDDFRQARRNLVVATPRSSNDEPVNLDLVHAQFPSGLCGHENALVRLINLQLELLNRAAAATSGQIWPAETREQIAAAIEATVLNTFRIPSAVRNAVVGAIEADAAVFTLLLIEADELKVAPWLKLQLVERMLGGFRRALAWLAVVVDCHGLDLAVAGVESIDVSKLNRQIELVAGYVQQLESA